MHPALRDSSAETQPSPSSCPSGLTHPEHVPSWPPTWAHGQHLSVRPPPRPQWVQELGAKLRTQVPEPALGRPLGQICTLGDPPPRGLPQGVTPHLPVQWGPPSPGRDSHLQRQHPRTHIYFCGLAPPSGHASCGLPRPPPHILPSLRVTLTPSLSRAGWRSLRGRVGSFQ